VTSSSIAEVPAILFAVATGVNGPEDFRTRIGGLRFGAHEEKDFFSAIADFSAAPLGRMQPDR
jgi:hypothetical protein